MNSVDREVQREVDLKDATDLRQANNKKVNYRVLTTSLLLAVVAGVILYTAWIYMAAPQVAPI